MKMLTSGSHWLSRHKLVPTYFIFAVLVLLIVFYYIHRSPFTENEIKSLNTLQEIEHLGFYTMTCYKDYKFDELLKRYQEQQADNPAFFVGPDNPEACSCFSAANEKGQRLYGRNLDLDGNHPALLLYTRPPNGYASVSMVELPSLGIPAGKDPSLYPKELLSAPYFPRDGMNEWGLAVSTLNAPRQNSDSAAFEGILGRWQVIRLLLDHAGDVDEAVHLLLKYNIYLDSGVHFFLADTSGKSAVVEFLNGEIQVVENKSSWQAVTNFLMSTPDKDGSGHDRYNLINSYLKARNGVISNISAMNLLKQVSHGNTAWSVVYNLASGDVNLALREEFDRVRAYTFKTK